MNTKKQKLSEILKVTLSDFMPIGGVAISLPGDSLPICISERLHSELKRYSVENSRSISSVFQELRDEVNSERKL